MIIIHGSLALGGIETFLVRLARERYLRALPTTIILLSDKNQSDQRLVSDAEKYADLYFSKDVTHFAWVPVFNKLHLLRPFKKSFLKKINPRTGQIHVGSGICALYALKLRNSLNIKANITVGFYHSLEFFWQAKTIPYFERINRKVVLSQIPKEHLLLFSENSIEYYKGFGFDLSRSQTFRLGVVEKTSLVRLKRYTDKLKICSVGRLVRFKQYNLWMLDIVKSLTDDGIQIMYDIYGIGELAIEMENRIRELGIEDLVTLRGEFLPSQFNDKVSEYDLFIGSGTSIIQASSIGVPSIIGVESLKEPYSYGFFSQNATIDYNFFNPNKELISVKKIILDFLSLNDSQKKILEEEHVKVSSIFRIDHCCNEFERLNGISVLQRPYLFQVLLYEASRLINEILRRLNKRHPLNHRYELNYK